MHQSCLVFTSLPSHCFACPCTQVLCVPSASHAEQPRELCSGPHPSRVLKDLALAIVCPRSGSLTPPTLPVEYDSVFRGPRPHPLHHRDRDTHPLSLCLQRPPASASLSKPPRNSPQQSCLRLQPLPPLHALSPSTPLVHPSPQAPVTRPTPAVSSSHSPLGSPDTADCPSCPSSQVSVSHACLLCLPPHGPQLLGLNFHGQHRLRSPNPRPFHKCLCHQPGCSCPGPSGRPCSLSCTHHSRHMAAISTAYPEPDPFPSSPRPHSWSESAESHCPLLQSPRRPLPRSAPTVARVVLVQG